MATKFITKNAGTIPTWVVSDTRYRDMLVSPGAASSTTGWYSADADGERTFGHSAGTSPFRFWSERVVDAVTISGTVTFAVWLTGVAGFTGRCRGRLYKITPNGNNAETLIAQGDDDVDIATSGQAEYTWTATPAVPVTVGPEERLLVRFSVFGTGVSESFGTGDPTFHFGEDAPGTGHTYVQVTETVTTRTNFTTVVTRRTNTIGIGTFLDLLVGLGGSGLASTTAVTDTQASGTEIQMTRLIQDGSFTPTELTAAGIASTLNVTTYASASFTPVANRLYLLAVCHSDAAPETTVPTIATTTGLTFVQVGTDVFDTIASNLHRVTLFRAMKPSGLSAGTYTVTLADAGTGCCATLVEITGLDTTGTDGANAIRNAVIAKGDASANPSATLGTFTESYNGAIAFVGSDIATVPTVGAGYTSLGHRTYATPTTGLFTEWRATNASAADCTLASSDWAVMAVELVNARSVGPVLEFITPRMKQPYYFSAAADVFGGVLYAHESNAAANATVRMKVFRRAPNGTETLVYTKSVTAELLTFSASQSITGGTLAQATVFNVDDRMVVRYYVINVGTMGGGETVTGNYDHNTLSGGAYVVLKQGPFFKAEAEPAAEPTSYMTMTGVRN